MATPELPGVLGSTRTDSGGSRPRLLDLFCGAGGCSMGYHLAGFDVDGVDIEPMPNYPFEFLQTDALAYLRLLMDTGGIEAFDAIHASPPCKAHTTAGAAWTNKLGDASERHADLIGPTRELLEATGLPWVIENVPGAPLRNYVVLCGLSFGLNVKRHRWFESSIFLWAPPPCPPHDDDFVIVFGGGVRGRTHQIGRTPNNSGPILRRPTLPLEVGREAMGIDWMNRMELSQAIPPAYTEWIGRQLIEAVEVAA